MQSGGVGMAGKAMRQRWSARLGTTGRRSALRLVALVVVSSLTGGLSLIAGQQPALADDTPVLLKDINPGAGASSPDGFAQLGGFAYFVSTDPTTPGLWKTNGSPAGTT